MKITSLTKNIALATTALGVIYMLNSCSSEDERVAPLKTEIESSVKAAIPPFLALEDLETEVIPVVENRVKINFKAKVKPIEDLYISDRYLNGDRSLMILKKSQANGKEANLYGSMFADRIMDKWDISRPDIESGMAQLGSPRGSFDSRAMIDGSDEMKKFFADHEAKQAELAKAEEERMRKSEEARLALVEKKRIEEEDRRKKLIDATAVGKRYRGFLQGIGNSSRIRQAFEIEFTSQSGALLTAEIRNPDEQTHKQTLGGELVFVQDPELIRERNEYSPITLSPKNASGEFMRDRLDMYFDHFIMRLSLSNEGLTGSAETNRGGRYTFRLQAAE